MKKNSNGKKVLIADSKDPFFFSSQMAILWFSFENFFIYTPNLLSFWFVVMRKNVRVTGSSAMFVVKIFGNDITWRVTWQPIKTEKKKRAWLMWMWTWVWILTKMFIIDYYARLLFFIAHFQTRQIPGPAPWIPRASFPHASGQWRPPSRRTHCDQLHTSHQHYFSPSNDITEGLGESLAEGAGPGSCGLVLSVK